ncbi:DNA translocase FtsK [uncultured Sphingobacterium sp.]|uniref:DNA translocase FtsK n=1 Tax=uncultured Sphingobacterium sp. TaxID=182688 RepID=UPI0025DBC637|nr:DNA translocase FtsK [uncultured Sphingobacterium sp.]
MIVELWIAITGRIHQLGSTSLFQRKLMIEHNRAVRIIDQLDAAAIVGAFEKSKEKRYNFRR